MFSKTALIAFALAAASSVDALSFLQPSGQVRAATPLDLGWNWSDADPRFTIELAHPSFRQDFALANNVDPASGGITVIMPALEVFDAQYVIRAVNVSNINQEYARTGAFSVEPPVSSTSSGSATTTSSSATNPPSGVSTTAGTMTVSNTNSNTRSGTTTGTSTGTTSTGTTGGNNTPTNTPQNGGGNGAASVGISLGAIAAGVFAAVGML